MQSGGSRVHTSHFLLLLEPGPAGSEQRSAARLGVTVTKKVGSAVARNRIKRLVREVFRRNRTLFPTRCDVVVVAKAGADRLGYEAVLDEVRRAQRSMERACGTASRAT